MTDGLGLEEVLLCFGAADEATGEAREMALRFSYQPGAGVTVGAHRRARPSPSSPADDYAPAGPRGAAARHRLPLRAHPARSPGRTASSPSTTSTSTGAWCRSTARRGATGPGSWSGSSRTPTEKHPGGHRARRPPRRSRPRSLGSVVRAGVHAGSSAAIDLAERMRRARGVVRDLVRSEDLARQRHREHGLGLARAAAAHHVHAGRGGEVNVVVAGINVGAQPYWNAEATMLHAHPGHPRHDARQRDGPHRQAGPRLLRRRLGRGQLRHRRLRPDHGPQRAGPVLGAPPRRRVRASCSPTTPTATSPRASGPRGAPSTADPVERDVRDSPHSGPGTDLHDGRRDLLRRDQPRAQEGVRHPVADERGDRPGPRRPSSAGRRWPTPRPPSSTTPTSAAYPVTVLGIESRPIPRHHFLPADGPDQWTAGTLFPLSSKKVARAINAASGNRPVVVLANLSGFDGSPESLRKRQLEYGAEIGRAVVNFDGPIVFCVVSRYHGGAFVVFSGGPERRHGGARGRGLLRLGHRRRARGRRGVRRRRGRPHRGRSPGGGPRGAG